MVSAGSSAIKDHPVATREQWLAARLELLAQEKEFTRLRDRLTRDRRALPWVRVEKPYLFEGPDGRETLAQLFGPHSQLVVYHFMFAPESAEGCRHCSFWADHFDAMGIHLNHRDVSMVAVSRAPLATIERFKQRMGWKFKWVSSGNNDFNYDYHVSFTPETLRSGAVMYNYRETDEGFSDREGVSVFYRGTGGVFHTYSCYARGIDMLNTTYQFLDLTPKGRDEEDGPQLWVRHHDRYSD
ncbi:MAG TPA: thioredoxin family protein [Gemmatimonadales bacterium]